MDERNRHIMADELRSGGAVQAGVPLNAFGKAITRGLHYLSQIGKAKPTLRKEVDEQIARMSRATETKDLDNFLQFKNIPDPPQDLTVDEELAMLLAANNKFTELKWGGGAPRDIWDLYEVHAGGAAIGGIGVRYGMKSLEGREEAYDAGVRGLPKPESTAFSEPFFEHAYEQGQSEAQAYWAAQGDKKYD